MKEQKANSGHVEGAPVHGDRDGGSPQVRADEAALLQSAIRVLLPPEASARLPEVDAVSGLLPFELREIWWRTGRAPAAPAPMPEQPLSPGIIGLFWRRLRAALALESHDS